MVFMLRSLSRRCPGLSYKTLSGPVFLLAIDLIGRKTQNQEVEREIISGNVHHSLR